MKLLKQTQNYLGVYIIIHGKEIFKLKAGCKSFNFPTHFLLVSISNGYSNSESREVSLNGNVYDVFNWLQFYW